MQENHDLINTFHEMELIEITLLNNVCGAGPILSATATSSGIRCQIRCTVPI
jgi:hypothetical protein